MARKEEVKTYTMAGGDKNRIIFGDRYVIAETPKGTVIQYDGVAFTVTESFDECVADLEGVTPAAQKTTTEPAATEGDT